MAPPLLRVDKARLSDQTYEILRELILRRDLMAGHRVDFDELQERLGVSRTPVKEAFNRLAKDGLVTIVPRRGTYITEFTAEDIAERFHLRQILETGVVDEVVANLTGTSLRKLQQLCGQMEAFDATDTSVSAYVDFLRNDSDFHYTIIALAGNNLLSSIYEDLNLHLRMASSFYLASDKQLDRVNQEHRQILSVLEAGNIAGLRKAMENHISNSTRAVESNMQVSQVAALS
jgi:DNA-binding GntR family transcriptional regulator